MQLKKRYLANTETKEFHRVVGLTTKCNIDDMKDEHKVFYTRGRAAKDAGYDACAYCNHYWKSKDNK